MAVNGCMTETRAKEIRLADNPYKEKPKPVTLSSGAFDRMPLRVET